MADPYTQGSESITQAEHVSPAKTGDNIVAKRVVGYVWNGSEWERQPVADKTYAVRIDDTTTANVTYIGKADIGSATSSAVWQIAKLDSSSGLIKTWADSNDSFDNIWDNRAGLTFG